MPVSFTAAAMRTHTRARRGEGHDMLRPVVAKIAAALATKEYTRVLEQAGLVDFTRRRPSSGAIGGNLARLARAP